MHTRFQYLHDSIQQLLLLSIKKLPNKEDLESILLSLSERSLTAEQRLNLLCLSISVEKSPVSFVNLVASYQDNTLSALFNFIILDLHDQGVPSEEIFNGVLSLPNSYHAVLLSNNPENEAELTLDYLFMLKDVARSPEAALAHLKLPYEYMPGASWNLYDAILASETTELIYALIDLHVLGATQYELLKHKKDDMFRLFQHASRHVEGDKLREFKNELEVIIEDEDNPYHQFFSTKRGFSGSNTFGKLRSLLDEVKVRLEGLDEVKITLEGFSAPSIVTSFWDGLANRAKGFFQPAPQIPSANFSEEDESKSRRGRNKLTFHDDL